MYYMFKKIDKTPFEKEEDFALLRSVLEKFEDKINTLPEGNAKKTILEDILSQCKICISQYNANFKKPGAEETYNDLIKANFTFDLYFMLLRVSSEDLIILG